VAQSSVGANADQLLALRHQVRADQAKVVLRRLDRHRAIDHNLFADPERAEALIADAQAMLALWRTEHLCSRDYIDHWAGVLAQDPAGIAAIIVIESSDRDVWWQCSPFVGDP
jgi:hypothetical protein